MKLLRNFFLRFLTALCVMAIAVSAYAGQRLTVLHFNDFHGWLEAHGAESPPVGGVARLATVVRRIEAENAQHGIATLLLFGGDAFVGTLISREFKGAAEIEMLGRLGVNAAVLGNHDFDFGTTVLTKRMGEARYPILGANVSWEKDGVPLAPPTVILDVAGTKLGIVGLVLEDTPRKTPAENVVGLHFANTIQTARHWWSTLDRSSDIQFALTHQGVKADIALARALPGLEAVVGGHDHVPPQEYCRVVRHIPVCQTPPYATYLGRIDFEVEGRAARLLSTTLIPLDETIRPDPQIARRVADFTRVIGKTYGRKIGVATTPLPHRRGVESPLGDVVTDAMRVVTHADVAVLNSGGIRRSLSQGVVTMKDAFEVLPFENHLVVLTLSGKKLQDLLDHSVSVGGSVFLQTSGLTGRVAQRKMEDVKVGGEVLDVAKSYRVVTVDFLVGGGDGYGFLAHTATTIQKTDLLIRDAFTRYVQSQRRISAPVDARMITTSPSPRAVRRGRR